MSIKQVKWHVAVLAVTVFAALTVLFALATVTSSAADVIIETDDQGNRTITMSDSTYDQQIFLEAGTTTTIKISGDNKLTYGLSPNYEDWCIYGEEYDRIGNLIITGNGTLETPNSGISCNDFTVNGGAKVKGLYAPNVYGNINVDNADIEAQSKTFNCGDSPSNKNIFSNARLYIKEGITLYASTVMTDCNVITESKGLDTYGENLELTINGGIFNIARDSTDTTRAIDIGFSVKAKNTVIKANSPCRVENLEMTDSTLDITAPAGLLGSGGEMLSALEGDKQVFSGCTINIDGDPYAGIHTDKQLIITGNSELNVKGMYFGILGKDVKITHSSVKSRATGSSAYAAIAGLDINEHDPQAALGTITLNSVAVKEPAGGKADIVYVKPDPGQERVAPITAITNGNAPAKSVVLEIKHSWDSGKVTKQPTETAEGIKKYTCTLCEATKTEAIPAQVSALGEDGTPFGKGASVKAAEAALLRLPDDNDPAGTVFGLLQLKASKTTKNSIKLTWKKVHGATQYILFANKCGKANKFKKVGTFNGTTYTATEVNGAKVKKGTYYKFIMIAADSNGRVVSTSKAIHAATKGGKVGNNKSVKASKSAVKKAKKLKKGKTIKLKAKAKAESRKLKVKKHRTIKYETSNPKVATVNGKGAVKGVGKGTCFVYAYAQNGVFARVKVTVK